MSARGERKPGVTKVDVRVLDVDANRFTARVQHVRGEQPADEVAFQTPYMANRGGGWMGAVPEVGDVAVMEQGSRSETWNITGYKALPRAEVSGRADENTTTHEFDEPRNNYAAGRSGVRPGDMGLWGSGGNRVVVRRSGVTEIVADEITWSRYFAREHTIRHAAATIETQGVFGSSTWYTLRDEERELAGATPTGFSAWVKTHAEAAPIVNLELGAVLEDEELSLPGRRKRHDRRKGAVCARFLVFDQNFADSQAALGRTPNPANARLAIRVDEEGNLTWMQAGHLTQKFSNLTQYVAGREYRSIQGGSDTETVGDWGVNSTGSMRLQAAQTMFLGAGGDVVLKAASFVINADNDSIQTRRNYTVDAGGSLAMRSAGVAELRGSTGMQVVSGGGMGTSVGGRWTADVFGSADVENLGRDVRNWGVKVHRGKAKLQATAGSFEIAIGPDASPLAILKLHADPRVPTQIGRIQIGFPLTGAGLTMSPDGSWSLEGIAAGIRCDPAGRIQLGADSPVAGYVVTTTSHPVDHVTGAPILGQANLLATPGPPAPFTGPGSTGVQPPTVLLPEEVAV